MYGAHITNNLINIEGTWGLPFWCGFVPTTMLMCMIGLMTSSAAGEWDPIALFTTAMSDSPVLIVSLIFIAFAQLTTNMYNNLIPALTGRLLQR